VRLALLNRYPLCVAKVYIPTSWQTFSKFVFPTNFDIDDSFSQSLEKIKNEVSMRKTYKID